ncbi:helix-turn-helix domain-containing protein [Candidatus Margulisiibacteriota bacterium]
MSIGSRIKKYREIRNMSQQDLSSAAGVSLGLIQQIEQGRHNNPSINVLDKIAVVLEVDVIHLIRDVIDSKPAKNEMKGQDKKARISDMPLFDHIPTEEEINKMNNVKTLAVMPPNKPDFAIELVGKGNFEAGAVRKRDLVSMRKVKYLKDTNVYVFVTKNDKVTHVGMCKIYEGNKVFLRGQSGGEAPIEYKKNDIRIVGEVVSWVKSPSNDAVPLKKIPI